jgi:hypothetical protein
VRAKGPVAALDHYFANAVAGARRGSPDGCECVVWQREDLLKPTSETEKRGLDMTRPFELRDMVTNEIAKDR